MRCHYQLEKLVAHFQQVSNLLLTIQLYSIEICIDFIP